MHLMKIKSTTSETDENNMSDDTNDSPDNKTLEKLKPEVQKLSRKILKRSNATEEFE